MIIIRQEQMKVLEAAYKKRRRISLWKNFKIAYPVLSKDIEEIKGIEIIDGCINDGMELDITEDDDILRFSALAFLPRNIRHDKWYSSIFIRILHNENLTAQERLSFIFNNVIDQKYIS